MPAVWRLVGSHGHEADLKGIVSLPKLSTTE